MKKFIENVASLIKKLVKAIIGLHKCEDQEEGTKKSKEEENKNKE